MTFEERLTHVLAMLERWGRVSYRALKRELDVDDAYVDDLKSEIVDVLQLAVDQDGTMLVWIGGRAGVNREAPAPSPAPPAPLAPAAERRQLTVMFCDLVGSTALSAQLDPEDLRDLLRGYQETAAAVIQRFGGSIAQYLGDGVLAYFGYPQAHEDAAQRAVRAGLGILDAMHERTAQARARLAVRVGVHTGPVLIDEVGGGSRQERLALGETPNVAARIQGFAAPDSVVISAATFRLVEGYFTCESAGAQTVKGLAQPIVLYRVVAESGATSRLEVTAPGALTPVVGREAEVKLLMDRWAQSKEGHGQVVLLTGEPGIGKSRLVDLLREQTVSEGGLRVTFRCSPYFANSALHPITEHLLRLLDIRRDDSPDAKLAKLERLLAGHRFADEKSAALFAALLSLPVPEGRYPPLRLSPLQQKQLTHEALTTWILEDAERRPILMVCEDLHWADPSMLDVLTLLIGQIPTARMLLLLTFRPEFDPPWAARSHVSQLTLSRFSRAHVETMVRQVMRGKGLPPEVVQHVVDKTDGVPLFVEELLKMILESGLLREEDGQYRLTGPLTSLAIPATLHDSLMARLDRLATAREIAQLGAALGREFLYDLIRAVASIDEPTLDRGLAELVDAELIYRRGQRTNATYLFKHALIRDAAYQSLLKSRRHFYHDRIARVLDERFPEIKETQPELLAYHYTEAGLDDAGITYWQRAGQRALERAANLEAIGHLSRALELLPNLADSPERRERELALQLAIAPAYMAIKSWSSPEVERASARALELCRDIGDTQRTFPALWGLWSHYFVKGDLAPALDSAHQVFRLAQGTDDPFLHVLAHHALGYTLYFQGDFVRALEHADAGRALFDVERERSIVRQYQFSSTVAMDAFGGAALWMLGYPDQATRRAERSLALATELAHPPTIAYALSASTWFHQLVRNAPRTRQDAERAIAMSEEFGFLLWIPMEKGFLGWALMEENEREKGLAVFRDGIVGYRAMAPAGLLFGVLSNQMMAMFAHSLWKSGLAEEALDALRDAIQNAATSRWRHCEPEFHRIRAEILVSQARGATDARLDDAEASVRHALDLARQQHAKSLTLRAALTLGRVSERRGRSDEARRLVAEIHASFTEGFDTPDLQDAKVLLAS